MALLTTVSTSAGAMAYTPTSAVTTLLREQLYDVVTNVDPYETPVLDMLRGGDNIESPIYQWPVDSLPGLVLNNTAGSVDVDGINVQGISEGFDGTGATAYPYTGQPERLTNFIHMFAAKIQVSDTLKNSRPTGIRDPYNWEKVKAGRVMKKACERRLFDNASANASFRAGTGGDPRAMKALFEWTSGNYVLNQVTANASILPSHVDSIMEATVTAGGAPSILAMGVGSKADLSVALRSLISSTQAVINQSNIAASEKRIIRSVDFYDGDYGTVAMMWSRQIPQGSATTAGGKVWALEPGKIEVTDYSPMQHIPLAKTGHNTKGILVWEVGNRVLSPRAIGVINGVTT